MLRVGALSPQSAATFQGLLSNTSIAGSNVTVYASATAMYADVSAGLLDAVFPSTYFSNNAAGSPNAASVRLLTGTPLGYMTTGTYFRSPVLDGASTAPLVPSTSALVYPPDLNANPLAVGDVQLRAALTAATNRIIRSNAWAAAWQPVAVGGDWGYAPFENCGGDPNAFPYPSASQAKGAFKQMLATGTLKAGYYAGVNLTSYNGALLQGTTPSLQVIGTGTAHMEALAVELSRAYGLTITVVWTVSTATPGVSSANNLWNLLFSGAVDVLAPTLLIGGDVNGTYARTLLMDPLPCDVYANPTILTVRNTEPRFTTVLELVAYIAAGNSVNVGAQTEPAALTAAAIFGPNAHVTLANASSLFKGLTTFPYTIDVVFRSSPPANLAGSLMRLGGSLSIASYTIFTRPPFYSLNTTLPARAGPGVLSPFSMPYITPVPTPDTGMAAPHDPKVVGLAVSTAFLTLGLIILSVMYMRKSQTAHARNSLHRPSKTGNVELAAMETANPVAVSVRSAPGPATLAGGRDW